MKANDHIIILADDDPDDQTIIREIFSIHSNNIKLLSASNGEEVLTLLDKLHLHNLRPCLIILDVNMPKVNGKEALLRIRQRADVKTCPVVLFSTATDPANEQFAKKHNADYLVKPFTYQNMESAIKSFISMCDLVCDNS